MFIPTTLCAALNSGPPESPGSSSLFASISPVRRWLPDSSVTVIARASAVTRPDEETRVPVPPALPVVVTACPTRTADELPSETVFRFGAPLACSTATSFETLYPSTFAV